MRIVCTTQHTAEWYDAKLGIPSGSGFWRAMATMKVSRGEKKKGDSAKERDDYMLELATEIMSGCPTEHYVSKAMDEGTENEPLARAEYRFVNDVEGEETGFVLHPTMDRFGCSPDLILPKGGAEYKCPQVMTHMASLRDYAKAKETLPEEQIPYAVIPEKYLWQVHSNILCCEKEWWDWCSFVPPDPERIILPPDLRMLQIRVYRDESWIKRIEDGVARFNEELLALVVELQRAMEKPKPKLLPGKYAPKSKFVRELEASVLAQEASEGDPRDMSSSYWDVVGDEVAP